MRLVGKVAIGCFFFVTPLLAQAQATGSTGGVRIGVMSDSSSLYAAIGGPGSYVAAKLAVEDFGGSVLGKPIEIIVGDHQNKVDVALALARRWVDEMGVTAFADVATSSTALAVQALENERQKAVVLISGGGARALSDDACSPVGINWVWNTYSVATGTARAAVKQGYSKWFMLAADYAFGQALEKDATEVIKAAGGEIVGSVRHPLNTPDFASYLVRALQSGANVIGLANAGGDTVNAIKQGEEFGLKEAGIHMAALLTFITDVHAIGLKQAQGLLLTTSFYWNRTPETRAWSMRFFKLHGAMPTMVQAGVYSSVSHYLKAVQAAGTTEARTVVAKMHEMPIHDIFADNGRIREDNVMVHDMYLAKVKSPSESKEPWDYYEILRRIPADELYWPLSASKCLLVTRPN
jgi:branched-chain amino acid transport system substrate-binding protein